MPFSRICSYNDAPILLTLIKVALFFLFPGRHSLLPLDTFHNYFLLPNRMPPPHPLHKSSIRIINVDRPLASTYLDLTQLAWEMKLREENLCRRVICSRRLT